MVGETSDSHPDAAVQYIYTENSYEPLARVDSHGEHADIFWYHTELNGLPDSVTDSNGDTVWRGASTAWGRSLRESTPVEWDTPQNLRFQGQYLDRETGLHYNTFRYYDPAGGCYTQMDPIGLAGGLNTYTYVVDPLGWVDPLGLQRLCAFGNRGGPKGIREKDLAPNKQGLLPSQEGMKRPQGKSVTRTPKESGLQGHYHILPEEVKMPDGLGIKHDGRDMPGGYMSPGHSTIYPTKDMTVDEFNDLFNSLPWEYGGKI